MRKPIVLYVNWLPFGLRGFCFPPLVAVHLDHQHERWCKQHEFAHWVQFRRHGWLGYFLGYLVRYIWYGYDRHPWELEARRRGWMPRPTKSRNQKLDIEQ